MKRNNHKSIKTGLSVRVMTAFLGVTLAAGMVTTFDGCASLAGTEEKEIGSAGSSADTAAEGIRKETADETADFLTETAQQMLKTTASSDENGKEETVYVLADASGEENQIIVSEHLKNGDKADNLTDVTDLTDIENTKGDETFRENADGTISWDAHGNDIFYRGTSDRELPLGVHVSFQLDGKEVTAEELAGADGHLTISFAYDNRQKRTVKLADEKITIQKPCVVVSGLLLDLETAQNVTVTNGKVIDDGSRAAAVGLAMPGMKENLDFSGLLEEDALDLEKTLTEQIPDQVTIEADVTDFSLTGTVTLVSYDVSSFLDMDTDHLEEKVETMKDSAAELADGTQELTDGAQTLSEYLEQMQGGTQELNDGVSQLREGAAALDDGAGSLVDGAKKVDDGTGSVAKGAGQVKDGAAQLADGAGSLQAGTEALSKGASSLAAGSDELAGGLAALSSSVAALPSGVSALRSGGEALRNALKSGKTDSTDQYGIYEAVTAMQNGADQLAAVLEEIMDGADSIHENCLALAAGAQSGSADPSEYGIYEAAEALEIGLGDTIASLQGSLQEAAGYLKTASSSDAAAMEALQNMAGSLQEALQEMVINGEMTPEQAQTVGGIVSEDALKQILTEIGTSQAITGQVAQQLTENAPDTTQLTAVLNAIKDGALQISQGARALAAGAKSGSSDPEQYGLYEAAAAAYAGARQLSGTAQQICSAIDTMTDDRNLGALVSGLEQLDEESVQLTAAIGQLSNGADSLKNGARALSDGTKEADNGARTLAGGAQQLKSGAGTLSEGAQQLKTGTAGLLDGAQQLKSGTGTLSEGTQTLLEGTENLKSGAAQLAEGSNDLVEGIKTLDEEAISKIAKLMGSDAGKLYERLSAVLEYAKEKESYTGCPEGIDCTVQYIYKTDGIGE